MIISIIGKTNVGKSTLFNKLNKFREVIVSNSKNTTRDRIYGNVIIKDYNFILIDTGGIEYKLKSEIYKNINEQTINSIKECDLIAFIIDYKNINNIDENIGNFLRKFNKNILLIINKIDNIEIEKKFSLNISSLYFKYSCNVSGLRGYGIKNLKNIIYNIYINEYKNKNENENENDYIYLKNNKLRKISIIGKTNVGKSTLINCLLKKNRMIISSKPNTTIDIVKNQLIFNNKKYILIDTSGIINTKSIKNTIMNFIQIKTLKTILNSDLILFILDITNDISLIEINKIKFILKNGKNLIICINKCDLYNDNKIKKKIKNIKLKLNFLYSIDFCVISSIKNLGIINLYKKIFSTLYKKYFFSSHKLFNIFKEAINKLNPLSSNNKYKPKLKFIHQISEKPITIMIHGNSLNLINKSYKRYIKKYFCEKLMINNKPIRFIFKNNFNPYI